MYTYIYTQPLGKIAFLLFALPIIWAVLREWAGEQRCLWRRGNAVVLALVLFVVIHMTLLSRETGEMALILKPFYRLLGENAHPEGFRLLLMNAFLFLPIGLSLSALLPDKLCTAPRIICTALFGFLLSLTIETLQYHLALGTAELDDVLTNTLGAAIGGAHVLLEPAAKKLLPYFRR